jgi:serine/threonine-protein kinase
MTMLPPGCRIGGYVIGRRSATGATSEVYEGRDAGTGAPVAVKVLHAAWRFDQEFVARFVNEAGALERIHHRHVVEIFEHGALPDGLPYMVLAWLPADLHRALARAAGPTEASTAVQVAAQIASALSALHERGLVHRDLKPANVMLTDERLARADVKLADLGLAKALPGEARALPVSTGGGALLGTWDYMAPEQWTRSKSVDPRADVYSLGVLMFQMLAGRLPFVADQPKDLMCLHLFEPPPLELLGAHLPDGLRDGVVGMLSKKVSGRPTMQEVAALLARPVPRSA